ncbi:MAG: prolyl-tRNA synthetase associated domain-containing protein, partial [Candidatus Diapherotrites archaeon]|nr:prolyl-tRNA synthetase associated domain-containing protein [Candidatus Diapherotrites archaeon]
KQKNRLFLVVIEGHKRLDMKALGKESGDELEFASAEKLLEILHLTPGSVSPLGLLYDTQNQVTLIMDETIWNSQKVNFHPNINTESLIFDQLNFHKLVEALAHPPRVLPL